MTDKMYWVWLTLKKELTPAVMAVLFEYYPNAKAVYEEQEFPETFKNDTAIYNALMDKSLSEAERVCEQAISLGIKILTYDDRLYPPQLREIPDPPYVLYAKGEVVPWDRLFCIGVVGTRRCTEYGMRATQHICADLAQRKVIIISGLAKGLDAVAARAALDAGTYTIAVLGCGADVIYPYENEELYHKIVQNGLILSEYPPGTEPKPEHFPIRNRIMAGLSRAVLVTQAPKRSGTLITAARALDYGRDVFAVPGNIFDGMSYGANSLIQSGAKLVSCAEDIISEYPFDRRLVREYVSKKNKNESKQKVKKKLERGGGVSKKLTFNTGKQKPEAAETSTQGTYIEISATSIELQAEEYGVNNEDKIVKALGSGAMGLDELSAETGITAQELNAELIMLEIYGKIKVLPGKQYELNI